MIRAYKGSARDQKMGQIGSVSPNIESVWCVMNFSSLHGQHLAASCAATEFLNETILSCWPANCNVMHTPCNVIHGRTHSWVSNTTTTSCSKVPSLILFRFPPFLSLSLPNPSWRKAARCHTDRAVTGIYWIQIF